MLPTQTQQGSRRSRQVAEGQGAAV